MADSRKGLILINTGPGKGRPRRRWVPALRAVGNGMKVLMLQFLKGSWHYGELDAVQVFGSSFTLKQMGRGFVKVGGAETDPEDVRPGRSSLGGSPRGNLFRRVGYGHPGRNQLRHRVWNARPAVVAEALRGRPEMVHIILTGRNAHPLLVELADTVTGNARGKTCL